jgi:hypothetical protein
MSNQSVTYTATRNLISGRSLNDQVNTDLILRTKSRGYRSKRTVAESLSNRRFITHLNSYTTWACSTPPLNGADAALMREFLDSVVDQQFSFDPDYTAGNSPNAIRTVILKSTSYKETRQGQQALQADNYFVFKFTMDEVA